MEGPKKPNESRPDKEPISPEDQEMINFRLSMHPLPDPTQDSEAERLERVRQLESLLDQFEIEHDLSALHAITDLTPADSRSHPIREPARLAINSIRTLLNLVREDPDVSQEQRDSIEARYIKFSRAVGMINNGKVDHTR